MSYVTINFDEKYYHVIRMIFDRRAGFPKSSAEIANWIIEHRNAQDRNKISPKEWVSYTGVYAGDDGQIIYYIDKKLDIVRSNLEELIKLDIVTGYDIEESE